MLLSRLAGPRQTCLPTPPTTPVPAATAQPPEHLPVAALIHSRWPMRRRSICEWVLGMKTLFETRSAGRSTVRLLIFIFVLVDLAGAIPLAKAAQLQAARVTRIIKDVKLLSGQAAPRPAAGNDDVSAGTAVRTGTESRTELTFADLTITRLGANTIFSFNEGTREIGLVGGAMLVEVPRGGAEVKIITAAITAGITGGTALFESNKGLPIKLLMLEGTGRFYRTGRPEAAVIVHGGEMVMMTLNGRITQPTKFNAALLYKTSKLITSFPELPNADLIAAVIEAQQAELSESPSNAGLGGGGDLDKRDLAIAASTASAIATGAPPTTGGASKFGSPTAITAPDPYVITNGTVISTDPKITTNGVTNLGKIYRGPAQDGPFLNWLGTTPTAFDNASGEPDPDQALPLACFLFSSLQFRDDPTVSTGTGGNTSVGFVSESGIRILSSGGLFTFSGFDHVAILALNGSIFTSAPASFANFGELFMEARGAGSNLTVPSISNLVSADLVAEGSVFVNQNVTVRDQIKSFAGNDFQTISTLQAHRIRIESLGSIHVTSSAQLLAVMGSTFIQPGSVTLLATGSNGSVDVSGQVQAGGVLDIEETGVVGVININAATLQGDIVKIGAFGGNGVLNIGGGSISAGTVLKLYAPSGNGQINFVANCSIGGNAVKDIAAGTVTIFNNVTFTIGGPQANVFTTTANYTGSGGNGTTTGTFAGSGANTQPLANAPPFHP